MGGGHGDFDAPDTDSDQRADLEELKADGGAAGLGEPGGAKADATQRADEHIGHRREPEPELVGAHRSSRGAVGEQVELAFLDPVFHLAAGAVELLVERAGLDLWPGQGGDEEAGIAVALGHLGFGDDAPGAAPAVARPPGEVLEAPRRLAGPAAPLGGLGKLAFYLGNQSI